MQAQFILNGSVSLVLSPENDAEEALMKLLGKQDNEIVVLRTNVHVLNKSHSSGLVIGLKAKYAKMGNEDTEEKV